MTEMTTAWLGLFVALLCLVSFGGALFIIEGPYLTWLRKWAEARKGWVPETLAKGLLCFTCQGFWWGAVFSLCWFWRVGDAYIVADTIFGGLAGSAFSTLASYGMDLYLVWRKKNG